MSRPTTYYAHSTEREDRSDWQPLAEHLRAVATLAAEWATSKRARNS